MLKESADEGRTWQASFVVVARSTDAGVTWTEASRVAGAGYNEASIAVTTDGRLMVAMRREAGGGQLDLYVTRSTNPAGPWTTRGILRPVATPVSARYLRITDPSAAPGASFLHEIEAYTTTDGF